MSEDFTDPFAELLAGPTFVLTSDQDWAPDWALRELLEIAARHDVPFHLFVTNASGALSERWPMDFTLGIHPNFLPGTTHGASPDEVIDSCLEIVGATNSFRTHRYAEDNHILLNLLSRGFVADSNLVTFLQPALAPIIHSTGLLRLPVFLEDDVFLWWRGPEMQFETVTSLLFSPGLKILNFHPSFVALNAPSVDYFERRRPALFGAPEQRRRLEPYDGCGVRTLLVELIETVQAAGFEFHSFPQLVDRAQACMRRALPDGLYRWPRDPATGL
jgi:hypothetical protein